MLAWLRGLYTTVHIYLFNHELYVFLRDYEYDPDDFVEVGPPGCPTAEDDE